MIHLENQMGGMKPPGIYPRMNSGEGAKFDDVKMTSNGEFLKL